MTQLTARSYAQALSSPPTLSFIRFRRLDGAPISDLSPWAVGDSLAGAVGRCPSARPLRGGDLMVRCGPDDAERLLGIGRIAGADVRAWAPDHLNTSQGSIFAPSLQHLSQRELEEGFARVGVRSVYRPPRAPKIRILTFPSSEPPTHVRAAYLSFEVRAILPKPMRCRRCQKFGHRQQHCRADSPTCTLCAQSGHDLNSCPSDSLLCASCGGPHASDNTGCPRWISESRLTLMMRRGWDRWEAKTYIQDHPSTDIDAPFPPPPTDTDLPPTSSVTAYPPLLSHPNPRRPSQPPRSQPSHHHHHPSSSTPTGRPAPPPLPPRPPGPGPAGARSSTTSSESGSVSQPHPNPHCSPSSRPRRMQLLDSPAAQPQRAPFHTPPAQPQRALPSPPPAQAQREPVFSSALLCPRPYLGPPTPSPPASAGAAGGVVAPVVTPCTSATLADPRAPSSSTAPRRPPSASPPAAPRRSPASSRSASCGPPSDRSPADPDDRPARRQSLSVSDLGDLLSTDTGSSSPSPATPPATRRRRLQPAPADPRPYSLRNPKP